MNLGFFWNLDNFIFESLTVNQDYDRDVHAVCVDFVLFDLVNQGSREPQESEDNEKNKVPLFNS